MIDEGKLSITENISIGKLALTVVHYYYHYHHYYFRILIGVMI